MAPEWHVPLCVVSSVVVHAIVVAFVPTGLAQRPVAPERELVFLSVEEVLAAEPPAPEPEAPPPEPPAPLPAAAVPPPRRETPPPLAPTPPPQQAEAESAPPPAAAQVMAATNPGAGGPVFTAGAAGGSAHGLGSTVREGETNPRAAQATEGTGPAVDLVGLTRGYMNLLSGRVRPGVTYPRAAIIAHIEGTVTLGLIVDENGQVVRWRVKRSSGHASLDSAVLEAAQRLGSVPAPPAELRPHWRQQEISVPVRMRL
ncbi:MAG: energy transducer TonB [Sandaracinaceae bacterium]|nr:energy transducer TonB [Sandaracinaceae bacterium]